MRNNITQAGSYGAEYQSNGKYLCIFNKRGQNNKGNSAVKFIYLDTVL